PSLPQISGKERLYLAESVAAVIEVKSNLSSQWEEVEKTVREVKKLRRPLKGCTKSHFGPRIQHERQEDRGRPQTLPLRSDPQPVEEAQAAAPAGQARRAAPLREPPRGPQRRLLRRPRRLRLADDARGPAPLEHLLRLLPQVAERWHL